MEGKRLVPVEDMLTKLKAALDARRDPNLYIVARTDALSVEGLAGAIERAQLYKDMGVDMAKVIGADKLDDFRQILKEVPGPQMANQSNANPKGTPSPAEFEAAGAAMMTFPSAALFAAVGEVTRAMRVLKRDRSLDNARQGFCQLDEYYALVGLNQQNAAEKDYLAAARKVVDARKNR
jgi:methylisocitrate lyase